jgi:hypothetical protein
MNYIMLWEKIFKTCFEDKNKKQKQTNKQITAHLLKKFPSVWSGKSLLLFLSFLISSRTLSTQ